MRELDHRLAYWALLLLLEALGLELASSECQGSIKWLGRSEAEMSVGSA